MCIYRKTKEHLRNSKWLDEMKGKIKLNHTGVTPRITAIIKDHKPGIPFRPIVTRCQGPKDYAEKAYASFHKMIIPPSKFSISSSEEFINY